MAAGMHYTQHSTKFTIDPESIYPLCGNIFATADFGLTTFDASLNPCPEFGAPPAFGFPAPAPCNRQPFEAFRLVRATVRPAMPVCPAGQMCPMYMPAPYTTNLYIREQRAMPA